MQLDRVAAALRPRPAWEAIDLGWLLARRFWPAIWRPWLIACIPIWVLAIGLARIQPWLGLGFLWWIQPLPERVVRHVLAGALFGNIPSAQETVREVPRLLRKNLVLELIGQRLLPVRSYVAPIAQLEGLRGKARRRRLRIILNRFQGEATSFALVLFGFEWVLVASVLALLMLLLPAGLTPSGTFEFDALARGQVSEGLGWTLGAIVALVLFATGPFRVASGFGLYITRRTVLEGWGVEQAFRRLAERLESGGQARRDQTTRPAPQTTNALAIGLLALALGTPLQLGADDAANSQALDVDSAVEQVLAGPDFGSTERQLDLFPDADLTPSASPQLPFASLFASMIEVALWIAAAALVAYLATSILRLTSDLKLPEPPPQAPPTTVAGLDVTPDSLPPNVAEEASRLWSEGRQREALGLLYRASIERFVSVEGLVLQEGDTEEECVARLPAGMLGETRAYFIHLTDAWKQCAYACRSLDDRFGQELCTSWGRLFEADQR